MPEPHSIPPRDDGAPAPGGTGPHGGPVEDSINVRLPKKPYRTSDGQGWVISDLHLFSGRSTFPRYRGRILDAVTRSDVSVLNGDIFDFRWSSLPSKEHSVREATLLLKTFAERNPNCDVHMVLGNHDHVGPFVSRLPALAEELPSFYWHPYYVKLGRNVFLHGDVSERTMTQSMLEAARAEGAHEETRGKVARFAYDAACMLGVQKIAYLTTIREKAATRVLDYLRAVDPSLLDGVQNIYFGHTHVPMEGYRHGGYTFFNTGAAVKGLSLRVLPVDL